METQRNGLKVHEDLTSTVKVVRDAKDDGVSSRFFIFYRQKFVVTPNCSSSGSKVLELSIFWIWCFLISKKV